MISELKSFIEMLEKYGLKAILGILVLGILGWGTNNFNIEIVDDYFKKDNGHFYRVYNNEVVPWLEAKDNCSKMGGHLVTITDKEEQEIVSELSGNDIFWIGAVRDGSSWRWVTNERFDFTNWSEGEPNNVMSNENVVMMYISGKWNDINGESTTVTFQGGKSKNIFYICEWEHKVNIILGKNNFHSFGLF